MFDLLVLPELSIPYQAAERATAIMDEDGAHIRIGHVEASFPPSLLPRKTRVAMVAVGLQPGFKVDDKVSLSPLVMLGPHTIGKLSDTFTLTLPLEVSQPEDVSVLASYTSAFEPPSWSELARHRFVVQNNQVVVTADHFSDYQAQCAAKAKVLTTGECLYFSISTRQYLDHKVLRVQSSFELTDCTKNLHPSYALSHHEKDSEERPVRIKPSEKLTMHLSSFDDCITQLDTPFDHDKILPCPLNESFFVLATEMEDTKRSPDSLFPREWRIEPPSKHNIASGTLSLEPTISQFLEGRGSVPPLRFDFKWSTQDMEKVGTNNFAPQKLGIIVSLLMSYDQEM